MSLVINNGVLRTSFRLADFYTRNIYIANRLLLDQKWREKMGLPENPNAYGPLTNGPDYSYMDGRPVPVGRNLKERLMQQREYAKKIIEFSKEMDFAVQRHEQMKIDEENNKKKILARKLKPKGMPFKRVKLTEK